MKEKTGPDELQHGIITAEHFRQRIHEGHDNHRPDHEGNPPVSVRVRIQAHGTARDECRAILTQTKLYRQVS